MYLLDKLNHSFWSLITHSLSLILTDIAMLSLYELAIPDVMINEKASILNEHN